MIMTWYFASDVIKQSWKYLHVDMKVHLYTNPKMLTSTAAVHDFDYDREEMIAQA